MGVWVSRQGSTISIEPLGTMDAVHIDGSGMTHLVDKVSGEVLRLLASAPRTAAEILNKIAEVVGDPEVTWEQIETDLLRPLEANDMIEELP